MAWTSSASAELVDAAKLARIIVARRAEGQASVRRAVPLVLKRAMLHLFARGLLFLHSAVSIAGASKRTLQVPRSALGSGALVSALPLWLTAPNRSTIRPVFGRGFAPMCALLFASSSLGCGRMIIGVLAETHDGSADAAPPKPAAMAAWEP